MSLRSGLEGRMARTLAAHAMRVAAPDSAEWTRAMIHELEHLPEGTSALSWALGCVLVSYRGRLRAMTRLPDLPRWLPAFVSGLGLHFACVYVGGYLAALAIPKAYFAFFGREHERLALAILGCITPAVPFFLLSLIWCRLTLHGKSSALRVSAWYCLAGMAVGLICVQVWSALGLRSAEALVDPPSFFAYLRRVTPPWWGFPPILALPGGLAVATLVSHRSGRMRRS